MMSPPVIVFLDVSTLGIVDNLQLIKELGEYREYDHTSHDMRIERSRNADIIITNKVQIDPLLIDACHRLKLVCVAATGMNNVDLDYAKQKGIEVRNVAGYSTESVAQTTFSMLFHLLHQNRYYDDYVRSGAYTQSKIFTHHGPEFWELKNKIFGIIGLGSIGKRVAEIATAFGTRVIYFSTSGNNLKSIYEHVDLIRLLELSDVISIHCPLNDRTKDLIGSNEFFRMKPGTFLLNMGRGGIVNEEALAKAIDAELIAGAGVDVLTAEPVRSDNPLLTIKKKEHLFITPHIAWASRESRHILVEKLAKNIREFIN
jgi:lactate dehydrogenase-like 2-hydroxyacid dehydrogenase